MTNEEVVRAFGNGYSARANNLWTNGCVLYSYRLPIALNTGTKILVGNYTASDRYYSHTTSKHVGYARRLKGAQVISASQFDLLGPRLSSEYLHRSY